MIRPFLPTIFICFIPALSLGQTLSNTPATLAYQPITAGQRLKWFTENTVGTTALAAGVISAGWGTLFNNPEEYGPHWEGFGKRYGMRMTGISTGNAIEAGLGAVWGEDPRYFRAEGKSFGGRVKHVVNMTFMAYDKNGGTMPAYARFAGIAGNNFLSNTWREPSESTNSRAVVRIGLGVLGRMAGNAFDEFWPDVKRKLHH